jgi:GNAT superfamily N-acetyltransferase
MESANVAVVRVVRYDTVQAFVDALAPFLRRSSWAANLLLAPAFAAPPHGEEDEEGGRTSQRSLFLATWSSSYPSTHTAKADGSKPVLVLARVGDFPVFVSFTDAASLADADRHVAALAGKLADLRHDEDDDDEAEWIGTVRRVMGPSELSQPLAHAVGRLIGRQPVLHWTLTAAACTASTLRPDEDPSPSPSAPAAHRRTGEVRRFEVGRDDEERLAALYQEFVHPPTPIDECRSHVRRTLNDEPGSRVFIYIEKEDKENKEEVIAGFLYLKRETPFNYAVSAVCTAPEYRRRGIAGSLVRAATRWALAPTHDHDHDHDLGDGGGGGKREVCIFWMDEAAGRIYRTAGYGEDGMMGAWTSWTFDGLDPGPWPA